MTSRLTALLTVVLTAGALAPADTLDDVEKKIAVLQEKITSFSAKIDTTTKIEQPGMSMEQSGNGTYEYLRKGEKALYRMEMDMKMKAGGRDMSGTQLAISDGQYTLSVADMMGQKRAVKTKAEDSPALAGSDMIAQLREDFELALAEDETINGQVCWVVVARPKQDANPMGPKAFHHMFRQSDGFPARVTGLDASGKTMMTMNWTDIKANAKIDPQRFELKAPEGVQVIDQTGE